VHLSQRSNWLRAAVLGANDGILSTSSLVLGVAASGASGAAIITAGVAGLVAGALSMAAGEYVSVSSQRDTERADIRLEERELLRDPDGELRELAGGYEQRGLAPALASEVAVALSRRGALTAHARDELGLDEQRLARPFQAAWTSALSFSGGAALPLLAVAAVRPRARVAVAVVVTLVARWIPPSDSRATSCPTYRSTNFWPLRRSDRCNRTARPNRYRNPLLLRGDAITRALREGAGHDRARRADDTR
jgi:vacuolar iron transporter family protein